MRENNWNKWPSEEILIKKGHSMLPNVIRNLYRSVDNFRETLYEELGISQENQLEKLLENYAKGMWKKILEDLGGRN